MRILILGGTRLMGPYIVQNLHAAGHEVTLFHRGQTNATQLPTDVQEILGDRDRLVEYAPQLRALQADVVLHMLAATEKQAEEFIAVFAGYTNRTVVASSQDVYQAFGRVNGTEDSEIDPALLSEESPLRKNLYPRRAYPGAENLDYDKILVERVVMSQPTLPGTILRLPAVYGPLDFQHRMFPYLKRMLDGRSSILLEEDVAQWRWTHGYVENMADAIALALTSEQASGRIYNVGEPFALSVAERVEQIARAANWQGQVVTLPVERVPEGQRFGVNAAQHIIADTSRLRQELGYTERVDLAEAFRRTIAWESANPPTKIDSAQFDYAAEDRALAGL